MKVIDNNKKKRKMVRIIIGSTETGSKSIKAPIKTISLIETNVKEVYEKIKRILEND